MPSGAKKSGKTRSRKLEKARAGEAPAPAAPAPAALAAIAGRAPLPAVPRRRARLAARDLFLSLPALVEADPKVSGLFFHDSFDKFREAVQASPDPASLKARALALLSCRDQIEGRFRSALSDVLEWHQRLQELVDRGGWMAEDAETATVSRGELKTAKNVE
jgi:hypothetical protein